VKSKVPARNGCDGKTTTIQVNLVPNPSETYTNSLVIKNFAISLPSQPFLGRHLGFHFLFTMAFLAPHFFLKLGCFGLDILSVYEIAYEQAERGLEQCDLNFYNVSSLAKVCSVLILT